MPQKDHTASGFTLIELGMVLLIISFVVGPVFTYLTAQRDRDSYQTTVTKQRKIAIALSKFAQNNGYLPCPSRPVTGSGPGTSDSIGMPLRACHVNGSFSRRKGIVPFRVLGLSLEDVTDGYGNAFTYMVSRAAVNIPENNLEIGGGSTIVHRDCSADNPNWGDAMANSPASRRKAFFCCRDANSGTGGGGNPALTIDVFNNAARTHRALWVQGRWLDTTATPSGPALQGHLPAPAAPFPPLRMAPDTADFPYYNNLRYFAYALISHGKNGEGAYIINSSNRKPWRTAGSAEQINGMIHDTDIRGYQVIDLPISTRAGNDYYDDIVLWRTQETTIAETGNNSCMLP